MTKTAAFTLAPADGGQKIVVTDRAGNTTEMTVTVNDGHTGGTATCTERAVCEVCGKAYGEPDPKNHTDLKHFPAKAATEDSEGNIEYWYCSGCGKYYSDKDGTKEIAKADTVTAKLPKSPQTGDNSNRKISNFSVITQQFFCRIPCILCISHLCTLHFCPGSGYTDINRYQIQRGNYENKEKSLTIMYISETQHSRPS